MIEEEKKEMEDKDKDRRRRSSSGRRRSSSSSRRRSSFGDEEERSSSRSSMRKLNSMGMEEVDDDERRRLRRKSSRSSRRSFQQEDDEKGESKGRSRSRRSSNNNEEDEDAPVLTKKKSSKKKKKKEKRKEAEDDEESVQGKQSVMTSSKSTSKLYDDRGAWFSLSGSLNDYSKKILWNCLHSKVTGSMVELITGVGLRPMMTGAEAESGKLSSSDKNTILEVQVRGMESLQLGNWTSHPVVRVSIVNGATGQYFYKRNADDFAVGQQEGASKGEKTRLENHLTREETKCRRIPGQITQPGSMGSQQSSTGQVSWRHLPPMLFNVPVKHLVHPNAVIFFEVLDFGTKIDKNELINGEGFYRIAWAFLKVVNTAGTPNFEITAKDEGTNAQGVRLQLYKYASDSWASRSICEFLEQDITKGAGPKVFYSYLCKQRERYPSSLEVAVRGVKKPEPIVTSDRPQHALQIEQQENDLNRLLDMSMGQDIVVGQEQGHLGNGSIQSARRHRLKSEPCIIPTDLVCRIKTGDMGCSDVQFSPDGQYLACACYEGKSYPIKIYDVATSALRFTLYGHQSIIYELSWQKVRDTSHRDEDGDELESKVSVSEEEDEYDDENGANKRKGHVLRLASASADGTARVWTIPDVERARRSVRSQLDHFEENDGAEENDELLGKEKRKDGSKSISTKSTATSSSTLSDKPRCEFILQHSPPTYVYTVQFHPQASDPPMLVTGSYDGSVRLWDCTNGKFLGKLDRGRAHHKSRVNTSCFTVDGNRLITGDGEGVVNVWRLETGRMASNPDAWHLARRIDDPDIRGKSVTTVQVHPVERQLLVAAQQNVVRLFELRRYTRIHQGFVGAPVSQSFVKACFSPDGQYVLSGGEDGKPHIWHSQSAIPVTEKTWRFGFPKPLYSMSWHPREHLVALCSFNGNFPVLMYEALRDTRDTNAKKVKTVADVEEEDTVETGKPLVPESSNDEEVEKKEDQPFSTEDKPRTRRLSAKLKALDSSSEDEDENENKRVTNQKKPIIPTTPTQIKSINALRKLHSMRRARSEQQQENEQNNQSSSDDDDDL